jgi:hypothetical protein
MPAVARFEAAALFPKPSLEFLAGHVDNEFETDLLRQSTEVLCHSGIA